MNKLCTRMISLSLVLSGLACSAQSIRVPFRQIEREVLQFARSRAPLEKASIGYSTEASPIASATSGFVYPQPGPKRPRVLDSKFLLMHGLHLGLAALDVGLTQHCISTHRCREGNPLMPSSLAGQVGVNAALISASAIVSYHLKKQDSKLWWFSPAVGIGAHTAGAATGFIYR